MIISVFLGALLLITMNWASIRFFPPPLAKIVLVSFCLLITCLCFWLAPQQLSQTGLASRDREPNYLAYYLSYLAGIIGLFNLILIISSQKYAGLFLAFSINAGLLLLSILLLFARL